MAYVLVRTSLSDPAPTFHGMTEVPYPGRKVVVSIGGVRSVMLVLDAWLTPGDTEAGVAVDGQALVAVLPDSPPPPPPP